MLRGSISFLFFSVAALATPTFNKDVLPILQKNCQECHRPGEVAPMSLLTYKDARPWAKAMKSAVLDKKMPPWFAEPQSRHFVNERRLTQDQVDTLVAWADNGAPEGDVKDRPAPITFKDGWSIKPDVVVEMMHDFPIPAKGTVEYQWVVAKANFTEDTWVTAAEIRPGNRQATHHERVYIRPPGSHFLEGAEPGVPLDEKAIAALGARRPEQSGRKEPPVETFVKWNPGLNEMVFSADGAAKLIPKGSDIVFQMHYTATGQPTSDRSRVGFVVAKNPPQRRYVTTGSVSGGPLVIPPGDPNYASVSEITVEKDTKLIWLQPHMHVRGKDYELRAIYPTGETETLLKTKFDFNWQIGYEFEKPVLLPKGTKLIGTAHFDNSPNNKFNPDPTATVRFGEQSWEEMNVCFMSVIVDSGTDPETLFKRPKAAPPVPSLVIE